MIFFFPNMFARRFSCKFSKTKNLYGSFLVSIKVNFALDFTSVFRDYFSKKSSNFFFFNQKISKYQRDLWVKSKSSKTNMLVLKLTELCRKTFRKKSKRLTWKPFEQNNLRSIRLQFLVSQYHISDTFLYAK